MVTLLFRSFNETLRSFSTRRIKMIQSQKQLYREANSTCILAYQVGQSKGHAPRSEAILHASHSDQRDICFGHRSILFTYFSFIILFIQILVVAYLSQNVVLLEILEKYVYCHCMLYMICYAINFNFITISTSCYAVMYILFLIFHVKKVRLIPNSI